jgi:hypothetical protein
MNAAAAAVVAFFAGLLDAIRKRRGIQAAAELPAGDEINTKIDADVAELERLAVGAEGNS